MSRNNDGMDTTLFLWVVVLIVAVLGIPALYAARAGEINGVLLSLAKGQLKGFVPFFDEAQTAWEHITGLDPASLTWERMQAILGYTGKWIRWPFALFLGILGAVSMFMSRTGGLVRRFNMESLLTNNAECFPCLRPVVGRGSYLLSPESYDSGSWRIARSPIQFALENGLLLDVNGAIFTPDQALHNGLASVELSAYGNAILDEIKAAAVLQAQLGDPFRGFDALRTERKALACAFAAYATGDKTGCMGILDAVSVSYVEKEDPACPVLEEHGFEKRLAKLWKRHKGIISEPLIIRHAAFELPWFMAMLTQARKKGVLASSQYLWIRPLDRALWYALNQCGGRAAWAEGFAAWAHYAAEEKVRKALPTPQVLPAVASLKESLSGQGWLADKALAALVQHGSSAPRMVPVFAAPAAEIEPVPDPYVVYAEAEEDPEAYDANQDKSLAQEQC